MTEVTTQSYFSRVKNSCSGLCLGPLLILAGIVLLIWNESNAVAHHRSLDQGESSTLSVLGISSIDAANEGKLVHVSGVVTTNVSIRDDLFGVEAPPDETFIKLRRSSTMYQWTETSQSKTETNTGGSTTTTTTYSYEKKWVNSLVPSSSFNKQEGHENPTTFPYASELFTADPTYFGAFLLPETIVDRMTWLSNYDGQLNASEIPDATLRNKTSVISGPSFYIGENSGSPQIGDIQVSFSVLKAPQTLSIIAMQQGNTFAPWRAKAGRSILLVQSGVKTQEEMYEDAHDNVTTIAWVLRFVGFLVIWFGLVQIMEPLTTVADVIPFCGNLLDTISCWVMFFVALFISLFVISLAWLAVRPLFSIPILLVLGGTFYYIRRRNKQKKDEKSKEELPITAPEKPVEPEVPVNPKVSADPEIHVEKEVVVVEEDIKV